MMFEPETILTYIYIHTSTPHHTTPYHTIPYQHTYIHPYIHAYIHPYRHNFIHTYIQEDRQTDGRTDARTDGRTDRQTYLHTYIHTDIHTYRHIPLSSPFFSACSHQIIGLPLLELYENIWHPLLTLLELTLLFTLFGFDQSSMFPWDFCWFNPSSSFIDCVTCRNPADHRLTLPPPSPAALKRLKVPSGELTKPCLLSVWLWMFGWNLHVQWMFDYVSRFGGI